MRAFDIKNMRFKVAEKKVTIRISKNSDCSGFKANRGEKDIKFFNWESAFWYGNKYYREQEN